MQMESTTIQPSIKPKLAFPWLIWATLFVGMVVTSLILSFPVLRDLIGLTEVLSPIDKEVGWFVLIGALAQLVDGAFGMAYGVTVTTLLLGLGIPGLTPAVASASMHASEVLTTGTSTLIYRKNKHIDPKLFRTLVLPGIIGAVLGVIAVVLLSKHYFIFIKPLVALYTLSLGMLIIRRTLHSKTAKSKRNGLTPVAFSGGFLDSVGGGGWGPIVTSTLLAQGHHLRYTIGSAHMAKFFVATVSTLMFFLLLGLSHWPIIAGLIFGGMCTAPLSIHLSTKIPVKQGLILVGIVIILVSLRTLIHFIVG